MANIKQKLFTDFAPVTTEQWEAKINADLKGKDYERALVWKTYEGFNVRPYYREENLKELNYLDTLPGEFPYVRGNKKTNNDWLVRQNIFVTDFETANKKYLESAKTYGPKPYKAKKSNLAEFVDKLLEAAATIFGVTDYSTDNGTEAAERIRQIEEMRGEFKKLAEESRVSALECQNILNFIREQRTRKK